MATLRQSVVARVTRLYPLASGCGRIANSALVQALAGPSREVVWAPVPGGEVLAPLDDYVGRSAFFVGELDRKISHLCRRLVRPGDTVLDIGANIGLVSVLLSSLVGKSGHVHAFEPNPSLVKLLEQVRERGALSNFQLHPVALGEVEGQLDLSMPEGNAGMGSLVRAHGEGSKHVLVRVKRLSQMLRDLDVSAIRFVKIDVEGFEPQVLSGGRDWFAAHPPDAILFELNDDADRFSEHPTFQILQELGYVFFSIPKYLFRLRLKEFIPGSSPKPESNDFLALHRGSSYVDTLAALS